MSEELKERRAEFIAKVRRFAEHLADEYNCDRVTADEDRKKGIWGEGLTALLEKEAGGDCSTNIKWSGGEVKEFDKGKSYECERPERKVEFRFCFSSPCVSVYLDHRKTFAELQFSDYMRDEEGEMRHSGFFILHETHAWGHHGGMPLLEKMRGEWEEFE